MERCRRESVEGYLFPRILTGARLLNVGLIHGDERDLVERAGFSKPGFLACSHLIEWKWYIKSDWIIGF